jgi:exodeoxyribonuclease VII large subunit
MPVYEVSHIARYVKESVEADALLADLWVQGEISNASLSAAGHWYFTMKDDRAQLRCVMFKPVGRKAGADNGGKHLRGGALVTVHGRISFYEARGDLQLYVDLVQPKGVGELALKLELLKKRLEEEGLFDESRRRPLPRFPQRIGVVTSPTSAAWQDIQHVISRRYPLVELVLAPCQVQGDASAPTIVEALAAMNAEPGLDAVIVARGGGSLEELWPFNEEPVARAIYACRVPVISGVGHETDTTIADLVADVRAPTPSAAAELAVPDARELRRQVSAHYRNLNMLALAEVARRRAALDGLDARAARRLPDVDALRLRVDELLARARNTAGSLTTLRQEQLRGLAFRLAALDPRAVLKRGYAVVQRRDTRAVVTSPNQVFPGDTLRVTVAEGEFGARAE